jgi:hypothetical protein
MTWDSRTVILTGGFMGRHKEELDRRCSVVGEQALPHAKDGRVRRWV